MSYMELGESHAWQRPATTVVDVDGNGNGNGNGNGAVEGKEEWGGKIGSVGAGAGGGGGGSGRIGNARAGVGSGRANVQSHGSSIYEDDFSGVYR